MHRDHEGLPQVLAPGRMLGGAVNTVLAASVGAGLAVVGAYFLSRSREQRGIAERIDKLEAMLQQLESKGDGGSKP